MAENEDSGRRPAPGSDAALRQLFDDHGLAIYRVARSVVREPALAEDVTQETLIRAWQHAGTYRGDAPLRHWLLRIAHNVAVSTLRTSREEPTDPDRLSTQTPVGPDRTVEDRMLIDQALARLDPLSRAIVVLREVEQLSYDEICDVLQLPLPTVKTRLFRARARLRDIGKEEGR